MLGFVQQTTLLSRNSTKTIYLYIYIYRINISWFLFNYASNHPSCMELEKRTLTRKGFESILIAPGFIPVFCGVRVAHLFSFLSCGFTFCLSWFCVLCPMLPVSLNCPSLIVSSVFFSVRHNLSKTLNFRILPNKVYFSVLLSQILVLYIFRY